MKITENLVRYAKNSFSKSPYCLINLVWLQNTQKLIYEIHLSSRWIDELGVLCPFQQFFSHIGTMERWMWKALCNDAQFRFGKNLVSNGIQTQDPMIWSECFSVFKMKLDETVYILIISCHKKKLPGPIRQYIIIINIWDMYHVYDIIFMFFC